MTNNVIKKQIQHPACRTIGICSRNNMLLHRYHDSLSTIISNNVRETRNFFPRWGKKANLILCFGRSFVLKPYG